MRTAVLDAERHLQGALNQLRAAGDLGELVAAAERAMLGITALLAEVKEVSNLGAVTLEDRRFHCPVLTQRLTVRSCAVNHSLLRETCLSCEVGAMNAGKLGPERLRELMEGVQV